MSKKKQLPDARLVLHQGVIDALRAESDRAAAVLGAAVLDAQLEDLFRSSLIHFTPKDSFDNLFAGSGPLASFSARINLAFSLGWISDDARRDLHVLRDVRNTFAHTYDHAASFTDDGIPARLESLRSLTPFREGLLQMIEGTVAEAQATTLSKFIKHMSSLREQFISAVATLSLLLSEARDRAKPSEEMRDQWETQTMTITLEPDESVSI